MSGPGILLLPVAAVLLIAGIRERIRVAQVQAAPPFRIGEATAGYIEINGTAAPIDGRVLHDPIEDVECLWFEIETAEFRKQSDGPDDWEVIKTAVTDREFELYDETDVCRVSPARAQRAIEDYSEVREGGLRHRIWRIRKGDPLYVVGQFTRFPPIRRSGEAERYRGRIGQPHYGKPFLLSNAAPGYLDSALTRDSNKYLIGAIILVGLGLYWS